jgi:hypothetical protein
LMGTPSRSSMGVASMGMPSTSSRGAPSSSSSMGAPSRSSGTSYGTSEYCNVPCACQSHMANNPVPANLAGYSHSHNILSSICQSSSHLYIYSIFTKCLLVPGNTESVTRTSCHTAQ